MRKRTSKLLVLVVSLLLSGLLLSASRPQLGADGTSQNRTRRVHVVAERFSFTPSEIKVKLGTTLVIELSSEDTVHGFRIAAAGVDARIPARGRGEIEVQLEAREPGRYVFECSRACGAGHTLMRGTVVVE